MKITAPISRLEEIPLLLQAGANELYCGIVPPDWVARFNTGAVNRRYFGNLPNYAALEQAVQTAHAGAGELFLVLNAQHYGENFHGALIDIATRFQGMGGDAVIVADLPLITALHDEVPDLAIHASSVANCRNSAAIALLRDLGVRRVILPRDVTLAEIERMARAAPDVEIEVFVLNDGCVFEEGLCHTVHLPSRLGGPICVDSYAMNYQDPAGQPLSSRLLRRHAQNDADYKRWLWYRFGCGFSNTEEGYPFGPCGLCAMQRMHQAGVTSVKVAGREGATERKIKSVEMVRQVLDGINQGADEGSAAALAVSIRKVPGHCASGYMCYYPEVRWTGPE
jgi:collagenase-like PrtC family protease